MADIIVARVSTIPAVANGDSLFFFEGEQTVDSGVDLSGIAGIAKCLVGRGFAGQIVDLKAVVTGTLHYDAGGGSMSYIVDGSGVDTTAKVWCTSPSGTLTIKTNGTVTDLEQSAGTVKVMDTAIVTNVRVFGGTCTLKYKASTITALTVGGGTVNNMRTVTTGYVTGGTLNVRREDTSSTLPTITSLFITGPATVNWNGGAFTNLYLYHPKARFNWQDTYAAGANLTPTLIEGFSEAIWASGLPMASGQVTTSKSGYTVTPTTVTAWAGKPEHYAAYGGGGGGPI